MEWTKIGIEYTETPEQKKRIEGAISRAEWLDLKDGLSVGLMPGMGIKGAIKEFRIPKVSHVAILHDLAPYGLYGIRGHYKNGEVDIFFVDEGTSIVPIGSIRKSA